MLVTVLIDIATTVNIIVIILIDCVTLPDKPPSQATPSQTFIRQLGFARFVGQKVARAHCANS